jgi:hypothetical protein
MATYRYVANDIRTSLNKAFDDADIRLNQILYWIQVVANRIRVDQNEITESGLFVSTFCNVPILKDAKDRQYFDLPNSIMDLPNEKGIVYITYNHDTGCCCDGPNFAQTYFQPTHVANLRTLYMDEYTKPAPANPYFYRIGDKFDGVDVNRIYLVGTDCIVVRDVEIAIRCSLDPSSVCDLDAQIPLPDERIEELMKAVLDIGRFVMLMPEERINQGSDETSMQQPDPPEVPQPLQIQEPENRV